MTHDDLTGLLATLDFPTPPADDPGLVAVLEARADATPTDPALRACLRAAHGLATAEAGLPAVVDEVHRERIIRWDDESTTWVGRIPATGHTAMVRVLRPHATRDPVWRRQLAREGRALARVIPSLRIGDTTLSLELSGPATILSGGGVVSSTAIVRLLVTGVADLTRWEEAGLGAPNPVAEELRDGGHHLAIQVLSLPEDDDARPALRRLGKHLSAWWDGEQDHPIADLAVCLASLPPAHASDAVPLTLRALADALAELRHTITTRTRHARSHARHEDLRRAIADLDRLMPPPAGRAALGVDLDGNTLVVDCDGDVLLWGTAHAEEPDVVFDLEEGFDVPLARRLVRARGEAPVSARLNHEVGGDPAFADQIVRWVDASLELRTLRMLLDAIGG